MTSRRRLLVSILSLVILVSALAMPFAASAGTWLRLTGKMMVPRNATEASVLSVGQFGVTVYPECMPDGGPVRINAFVGPNGEFRVQFTPEQDFEAPVMLDFGTAAQVVYESGRGSAVLATADLDGDGEVGEIWSDHFSRYSGW